MGGTGFIAGVRSTRLEEALHPYAITNAHVAIDSGHSTIRVNRRDGGVDAFEFDPAEWLRHPKGDDLAIMSLFNIVDSNIHSVRILDESMFLTEEIAESEDIGPGDDVFMPGRFVNHDGRERNEPSVRFGNISMKPRSIKQSGARSGFEQLSYAAELRSMGGYSGAPVFVFRGPWNLRSPGLTVNNKVNLWFLGVNWGHVTDDWEVREKAMRPSTLSQEAKRDHKINYVAANTGMNGIVPAWKVRELMDHQKLVAQRLQHDRRLAEVNSMS